MENGLLKSKSASEKILHIHMTGINGKNQLKKIQNHDRMNLGRFSTDSEYLRNKSYKSENPCLKNQVNKKRELQWDSESPGKMQNGDKRMAMKVHRGTQYGILKT